MEDPFGGIDHHDLWPDTGRKFDEGKTEYGLIPAAALHEIARVLTIGARKYSRDNWKRVPDGPRRYFDAMMRHLWATKRGEMNDPETGISHFAHAGCCLLFLLETELTESEKPELTESRTHQADLK